MDNVVVPGTKDTQESGDWEWLPCFFFWGITSLVGFAAGALIGVYFDILFGTTIVYFTLVVLINHY